MSGSERAGVKVSTRREVRVLSLANPPVNALAAPVVEELYRELESALADTSVNALVVTGEGGVFIAGADINRLQRIARGEALATSSAPTLLDVNALLESAAKPCVAAIDGFALGGGLELALACHGRVGTPRARLGLPELRLGLIPGAGGTQRLPRLIGAEAALEMMLTSRELRGADAQRLGLLDVLADAESLLETACDLARKLAARGQWVTSLKRGDRIGDLPTARAVAESQLEAVRARYRNQHQADACVRAVLAGVEHGAKHGAKVERDAFLELLASTETRALIHVFFAERAVGRADLPKTRELRSVGLVGAGTMGRGIAVSLLNAGLRVTVVESDAERVASARDVIEGLLLHEVERGRSTREQAAERSACLRMATDLEALASVDFVIEAVPEDLELKRRLFVELGRILLAHVPRASTSSTLEPALLRQSGQTSGPLLGLHFFSPAQGMKLVEVISDEATDPQALADARALVKRVKKTPVLVRSCPGFLVNRIFMPYSQATGFLIDRGVEPDRIDRALFDFGMPKGPSRVGAPTGNAAALDLSDDDIVAHLLYPVVNEAHRALGEGVVGAASDIDVSAILAYGFPSYRGGPMFWAEQGGLPHVATRLEEWALRYSAPLFAPCEALLAAASTAASSAAPSA
ncbi:MAG: 3-hydroxyacyl-CoA dehydrogenase NAD-binding domain-containing protein [Polyangiaceae bacterium]